MTKTKATCPNCGTNLTLSVSKIANGQPQKNINPSNKHTMNVEAKLEALKAAGVNVDNLFSIKGVNGQKNIARMENGKLQIVADNDPIFKKILNSGTVNNPQLFRRWVMAQVFHMLATDNFSEALRRKGYPYQWKMLVDEMETQAKMCERGDLENFVMRNNFFNKEKVISIAADYCKLLEHRVKTLPIKHCKGACYIRLQGKNILGIDIQSHIYLPVNDAFLEIAKADTPSDLAFATKQFAKLIKKIWMSFDAPMSRTFIDCYKGAGAYFTMRNLILFHGAKFDFGEEVISTQARSLAHLELKADEYSNEGWRLFGVMKQLIRDSNINIKQKIAEWRK